MQLAINRVHDPLAELKNLADEDLPAAANGSDDEAVPAVAGNVMPMAAAVALPEEGMDLRAYLENLERSLITKALEAAGGTVAQAARLLGLRRTTLVEKLRKYGLAAGELTATGT